MLQILKAACIQLNSGTNEKENLEVAFQLINSACERGANIIFTPEYTNFFTSSKEELLLYASYEDKTYSLKTFCALAKKNKVWLHIGSIIIKNVNDTLVNRSFLINPYGKIVARYDKIHLFDSKLENGVYYSESKLFLPGTQAVIAKTPWGNLGLTLCYDVRFPYLYRSMMQHGVDFFVIPSAFTAFTGKSHWHPLLLARAIETSCFIFAPNQCGIHDFEYECFGHSLIISPWGEILGEAGTLPGIILSEINLEDLMIARRRLESTTFNRTFSINIVNDLRMT